jgi:phosphoglycerate dehydrogenase-like enzyme
MKYKAVVTGTKLASQYVERLEALGVSVVNGSQEILTNMGVPVDISDRELTEDEAVQALGDADIYIYGGLEPASKNVLQATEKLKMINFLGTGWSDPGCVDAEAAGAIGVAVTNTPHANALSVAEASIGLLLTLERGFFRMNRETRGGDWLPLRRRDLAGKTLGIVGLGAIGSKLARIAIAGFGMKVVYNGPNAKPDLESELGVERLSLESLIERSDFVSIHAPAQKASGLIDQSLLSRARKDMVLINLSAPEIIEPIAAINALEADHIRMAMDGMYADEDIKRRFLNITDDRFVILPRAAWLTDDSYNRMSDMALESISDFINENEIRHRVL